MIKTDMSLKDVKSGYVFMFYAYGTKKTCAPKMLRLEDCYVELGGAFDCVDMLDHVDIDDNTEIVCVMGKFKSCYVIRGSK